MIDKNISKSNYYEPVGLKADSIGERKRTLSKKELIKEEPEKALPSKAEMAANLAKSLKRTVKAAASGDGVAAGLELKNKRTNICKGCPWFIKDSSRCAKCGCFVPLKAYLKEEVCPIGKW
jgi:hypothetical protein